MAADISSATNQRPIEVGDKLNALGTLVADAHYKTLIKAETTSVIKQRDVEFTGTQPSA